MNNKKINYIVKRTYANTRTGTDAFASLIKKDKSLEHTKLKIETNKKACYNKNDFRKSCVIPENQEEE